jgi:hypothetical protein
MDYPRPPSPGAKHPVEPPVPVASPLVPADPVAEKPPEKVRYAHGKNPKMPYHQRKVPASSRALKPATLPDGRVVLRRRSGQIPKPADYNQNHPVNWNHRHQMILYMHLMGQRTKDIAETLGYAADRVSSILNSPLFQSQKDALLRDLQGKTIEDLVELIRRDAPTNFQALVSLRDQFADHGGDAKVRLGAARAISREQDRVWPRRTEHTEERTIRIVIDQSALNRMGTAMKEIGEPIDASFEEVGETEDDRPLLQPKGIDDLMLELQERAREAEAADPATAPS